MSTHTYNIRGMHCASCAQIITRKITALPHVRDASVNYGNEKARIDFDESMTGIDEFNEEIGKLGYTLEDTSSRTENMSKSHHATPKEDELVRLEEKTLFILPITLATFLLMLWEILARIVAPIPNLPIPMQWFNTITMILATIALFWVGRPYLEGVVRFVRFRVANMDTLVGIGTLVAYTYSTLITLFPEIVSLLRIPAYTYFDVTIVVIGFITLGKYLEARSKKRTGEAVEKLLGLQAKSAHVLRDGNDVEIPIEKVVPGDIVIIKPGAKIPVDGIVLDGSSYVDESMITGEPIPTEKKSGDTVIAGTMNTNGTFTFTATKVGSETMLAEIIRMVDNAQGSKAPIEALADKVSRVFVPAVLLFAVITLFAWLSIGTYYLGLTEAMALGILSFVSILVIACPCALGLATPTAIIVGVGKGAKNGILVKDAATLEHLHRVDTVIVDKTGTLTVGKPVVTDIESTIPETEFMSILSTLERASEHPIAHAIVTHAANKGIATKDLSNFELIQGRGIRGDVDKNTYIAGNVAFMKESGLAIRMDNIARYTQEGKTPVILARDGTMIGFVMVADELKEGSARAVAHLQRMGIRVIMATGDDERTARFIANKAGITEVVAHVLPKDKLELITKLQNEGRIVVMAGDGVNDAPALAQANVGIAMGSGTDVAIASAGITLLHGDITKLVKAIRLAKITMRGIKQNLFWAFVYNIVGIPLAAGALYPLFGLLLNPVFAGLAMAFSSVSVVTNSLRIKAKQL